MNGRYSSVMSAEREIIFEFVQMAGSVKVTAVDVSTGIEASIVADPAAGEVALKHFARQKLNYVMAKKKG